PRSLLPASSSRRSSNDVRHLCCASDDESLESSSWRGSESWIRLRSIITGIAEATGPRELIPDHEVCTVPRPAPRSTSRKQIEPRTGRHEFNSLRLQLPNRDCSLAHSL